MILKIVILLLLTVNLCGLVNLKILEEEIAKTKEIIALYQQKL